MRLKSDQPLVSIIIVSYNSLKFLGECLSSVLKTEYDNFEVVLVDNASTDGSIDYVEKKFGHHHRLNIIRNEENLGFAEGNNVGVGVAGGDFVVFLNPDTVVKSDWLGELLNVMENNPRIGICQSKLLSMNNPEILDSAGDFIDYYGVMMRRGGDWKERDKGQYDSVGEIFSARGASMMTRRSVINEVGLFDPAFFVTYEDIDFCWRARLRGYQVYFVPTSVVYHVGEAFTSTSFKVFFTTRNRIITLIKNYELASLVRFLPHIIVVSIFTIAAELMIRNRPRLACNRLRGILWVLLNFGRVWKEHVKIKYRIRKATDSQVMQHMVKTNLAVSYWLPLWRKTKLYDEAHYIQKQSFKGRFVD